MEAICCLCSCRNGARRYMGASTQAMAKNDIKTSITPLPFESHLFTIHILPTLTV